MAKAVGYIPTSVSSAIKKNNYSLGNNYTSSGTVYKKQNLRDQGYPDSRGSYSTSSKTTTVSTPKATTTKKAATVSTPSYSSSSSYSEPDYSSSYSDYDYDYARQEAAAESYNALLAEYKRQQEQYEEQLRQRREAAQKAYDRGMTSLNSAYDSQIGSLGSNLADTKNQLLSQYNQSKSSINTDAENSLRQAYINKMLSEKNLGQQLSAQGLTGGATESTLAGMLNNYGNARNNINTTTNNNLTNLEGNYSSNLSQAQQAYNTAVANANAQKSQQIMALENALANNETSALADYQSLLQKDNQNFLDLMKTAIANGVSFKYDPTSADNTVRAVAYNQASNPTLATNYAALQELLNAANGASGNTSGITLTDPTTQNNYLANILAQLKGA